MKRQFCGINAPLRHGGVYETVMTSEEQGGALLTISSALIWQSCSECADALSEVAMRNIPACRCYGASVSRPAPTGLDWDGMAQEARPGHREANLLMCRFILRRVVFWSYFSTHCEHTRMHPYTPHWDELVSSFLFLRDRSWIYQAS